MFRHHQPARLRSTRRLDSPGSMYRADLVVGPEWKTQRYSRLSLDNACRRGRPDQEAFGALRAERARPSAAEYREMLQLPGTTVLRVSLFDQCRLLSSDSAGSSS